MAKTVEKPAVQETAKIQRMPKAKDKRIDLDKKPKKFLVPKVVMPDKKVKATATRLMPLRPSPFEIPDYVRKHYMDKFPGKDMHYTWQTEEEIAFFENLGYEVVKRKDGKDLESKKMICMAITQEDYDLKVEFPALHEDAVQRQDGMVFKERSRKAMTYDDVSDYEPVTNMEEILSGE